MFRCFGVFQYFYEPIASNKPSNPILNFFDFLLKNHAFGNELVPYMLPLFLHPEDIDKDFVSGNQEFYLP